MGLSLVKPELLEHARLYPAAVLRELSEKKPGMEQAVAKLECATSQELVQSLRGYRLEKFYDQLTSKSEVDPDLLCLSTHQKNVIIDHRLHAWLQTLESAISAWQHSDYASLPHQELELIAFTVSYEWTAGWKRDIILTLAEISHLRTFLFEILELPIAAASAGPEYISMGLISLSPLST